MRSAVVSSEAKFFKEITDHEFAQSLSGNNVIVADKLNRKTMMRALIWQLSRTDNLKRNLRPIIETVHYGETNGSKIETYKFIFGDKYPCSELTLNLRNDKEFLGSLYDEIESLKPEDSKELFAAYSYVNSLASKIGARTIIVDVGWGGTVQTLFAEFCQNIDGSRDVSGLYLGAHPADRFPIQDTLLDGYLMKNVRDGKDREIWNAVVWEYAYTNKIQFDSDELHLGLIQYGIQKGIEFFRNTTLSPYDYFFHVSRRQIRRLLQNPSRQEVKALGNIEFDRGFIKESSFNIVNMNYSQKAFYKMLIRNPRHTILDVIYATNNWPAGYIKYYRLFGLRTALRIYGKIRKKRYI